MGFRSGFSRANCVEKIKNNMGQIEKEGKNRALSVSTLVLKGTL